jgi:undecaprenyl diphosphate synthase
MTLPRHIAVIMDGNGRWAQARGLPRSSGHQAGLEPVRMCIRECVGRQIGALTVFAFSSENWQRPTEEVQRLMSLFLEALAHELNQLLDNGVRLRFIGERQLLNGDLQSQMQLAETRTAGNATLNLQVAVSYGGRSDIVQAAQRLAARCQRGELQPAEIDEARFAGVVALADLPEPDLFIRTGGERRISNFLLWNLAYTELYFTDTLWPDFDAAAFASALDDYAARQRRFGLTAAQFPGAP